jgi:hypothetical protein
LEAIIEIESYLNDADFDTFWKILWWDSLALNKWKLLEKQVISIIETLN